jgi:hypothetical protein
LAFFAVTRLADRLAAALREDRFTVRLRRPAVRVVRVARIGFALTGRLSVHRLVSRFSKTSGPYFLRSTMFLSVRLLFRVFFPSVGKAHGVCG